MCTSDIFLGFLAILFPPIAVWVKRGICSADSLINLGLCCLGILPGLLHAWYIIAAYPDIPAEYSTIEHDPEAGPPVGGATVAYYYVQPVPLPGARYAQGQQQGVQPKGYGTVNPERQFPGQQSSGAGNSFAKGGKVQVGHVRSGVGEGVEEGGSSAEVPPSYSEAVEGDPTIQRQD